MLEKLTFGLWPRCGEEGPVDHAKTMFERRRIKCCTVLALSVFTCGILYLGYFCPDKVCALSGSTPSPQYKSQIDAYLNTASGIRPRFDVKDLSRNYDFDINGDFDVFVYLHIQKTGGTTFGKHLVKNIELAKPCQCYTGKKKCDCENDKGHTWIFSRYSTGWRCGLHADWTELHSCVDTYLDKQERYHRNRRYRYKLLFFTIMLYFVN